MTYCLMSICLQGIFTYFMGVGVLVHSSNFEIVSSYILKLVMVCPALRIKLQTLTMFKQTKNELD